MIDFTWDLRKAKRNELRHGVSFSLAQAAVETGLGVEVGEQYRGGEWRTVVIAPIHGIFLHIIFAFYPQGDHEEFSPYRNEEPEQVWTGTEGEIRIVTARKAKAHEQALYVAAHPETLG